MALDTVVNTYTYTPIESAVPGHDLVQFSVNLAVSQTYAKGSAIGEVTATPGTFGPYASGNSDGTQLARAIVPYTYATDASGNITVGQTADPAGVTKKAVPAIFYGFVRTQDIVGLDADLTTQLGKRVKGTNSAGIFLIR